MKRTTLSLCAAAFIAFASGSQAATTEAKPNIVAIVTDDQSAWSLGCYGSDEMTTPNFDRIASSGVRFENAFVHSPVCSPSRGTYLTGLFPTQFGVTDWLSDHQAKTQGMTPATPTWPSVLASNGYVTGLIGKWHLGASKDSLPWRNGLTKFTGDLSGGWHPQNVQFITEKGGKLAPAGFSVDICTDLATEFIDGHKEAPFALLLHYREPHAPYAPMPEEDMAKASEAKVKAPDFPGLKQPYTDENRRAYYASIAALDRSVGRILDHLEKSGLSKNTIVVFTSDHGYNIGEHGMRFKGNGYLITTENFQQWRPNMFDSSIRVPLMISGPIVRKPGSTCDDWVTNADMFATVLGMAGIEKPASAPATTRDFSPALRGEALAPDQFPRELFGQYDLVNCPVRARMRMLRDENWKLVLHLDDSGRNELYDLQADPGERTNLFGKPGTEETVGKLTARLRKHMKAIDDPRLEELP